MASLILIKSPGGTAQREEVKLEGDLILIGRSPEECQIIIPGQSVSRKHAQILLEAGRYSIEDLRSRNKTYVNNVEVEAPTRRVLKHDDRVKICDFVFQFQDDAVKSTPVRDLPESLRRNSREVVETGEIESEPNTTSTIEATMVRMSHDQLLDTQPADRLRALLEVSTLLSKQVKVDDLLNEVAEVLFKLFKQADRCFIITTENEGKTLIPKVVKTRRPGIGGDRFSRTIVRKCLDSMACFISEDASGDSALAPSASIAEFRIKSVVCAPMITPEGKALGVIQVDGDRSKKFGKDDMSLLSAVATQAAVALENVKLTENVLSREKERREVELASQVQRGFLPRSFPACQGYDFFAHYLAAMTIGGDYYDFIALPNGKIAILLGDVSGKSVPAALLMAKLSSDARSAVLLNPNDLKAAIEYLNDRMVEADLGDRYATLCATLLDPVTHTVQMVNAGHETPIIYRAATGELEPAISSDLSSFPLCWVPGNDYPIHSFTLNPGDCLILFTDGVNDAQNLEDVSFGREGINNVLLGDSDGEVEIANLLFPQTIGDRIIKAVQKHSAGRSQFDDIALVVYGRVDQSAITGMNRAPNSGAIRNE